MHAPHDMEQFITSCAAAVLQARAHETLDAGVAGPYVAAEASRSGSMQMQLYQRLFVSANFF